MQEPLSLCPAASGSVTRYLQGKGVNSWYYRPLGSAVRILNFNSKSESLFSTWTLNCCSVRAPGLQMNPTWGLTWPYKQGEQVWYTTSSLAFLTPFWHQKGHRSHFGPCSCPVGMACHSRPRKHCPTQKQKQQHKRKTNWLFSFSNVCFAASILLNLACLFLDLLKIDKPVIISCWKAPFHNIECHKNMINSATVNSPTSTEII